MAKTDFLKAHLFAIDSNTLEKHGTKQALYSPTRGGSFVLIIN